jgi:hypothetical protein
MHAPRQEGVLHKTVLTANRAAAGGRAVAGEPCARHVLLEDCAASLRRVGPPIVAFALRQALSMMRALLVADVTARLAAPRLSTLGAIRRAESGGRRRRTGMATVIDNPLLMRRRRRRRWRRRRQHLLGLIVKRALPSIRIAAHVRGTWGSRRRAGQGVLRVPTRRSSCSQGRGIL